MIYCSLTLCVYYYYYLTTYLLYDILNLNNVSMAQQIARNIIVFSLSLILILSAGPLQAMAFSDQYASFQKSNQETYRQPSASQSRKPGQVRSYTQQIKRRNDQSALSQRPLS